MNSAKIRVHPDFENLVRDYARRHNVSMTEASREIAREFKVSNIAKKKMKEVEELFRWGI